MSSETSDWQDFLAEAVDIIEGATSTEVSGPVLDRMLQDATKEMRVVIQRMTLEEGNPAENMRVDYDANENPERPFALRLPEDHHRALNAMSMSTMLNQQMYGKGLYGEANTQSDVEEAMGFLKFLTSLAVLIDEEFEGDEMTVAVASALQSVKELPRTGQQFSGVTAERFRPEKRKEILSLLRSQIFAGWSEGGRAESISKILGTAIFTNLQKEFGDDFSAMIQKFVEIAKRRGIIRRKLLQALRMELMVPDRMLANAIVRQGTRTLGEHAREVTDHEWMETVRLQQEQIMSDPKLVSLVTSSPERTERNEHRKRHIAEYFGTNPNGEPPRLLREAIGTEQYRKRIRQMEKLHDPVGYMSLQKEILFAVNRHVARYHTRMMDENKRPASYRLGCPSYVIHNKDASCFSGPWLMAALMEDAGINPERIFYCNVQRAKNGTIGGHGTLVCTTGGVGINSFSEVLFADHGLMMTGKNLPIHMCGDQETYTAVQELFTHKHKNMVQLQFPEHTHRIFDIHPNMQIMPLYQGLTTGHLLHTGIAFLHEGKLDEAEHSFELGLTYNPKDPDLLYYLGIIHFMQNEPSEAYGAFTGALGVFEDHVQSRYSLGELHLSQGDTKSAKEAFARVAAVKKDDIWGDTDFHDKAVRYAALENDALLSAWADSAKTSEFDKSSES